MIRKWAPRIILVVVSIAVVFTVIELTIRSRLPSEQGAEFLVPSPSNIDVPYVLKENTDQLFEGHFVKIPATRVRISAQGFRENSVYSNNPTKTRLIALGDSFVFGSGVEIEDTFVKRLQQQRNDLEIINMGVPGYNSTHAVEWFHQRGLALKPSAVLLFISDNDFYDEGKKRLTERQEDGSDWATKRFVDYRLRKKEKADSAWRRDPKIVLNKLRSALERLQSLCRDNNIELKLFLLFPHELETQIKAFGMGVTRLTDAAYLKDIQALQIPKDLHPNNEGHQRLSDLLARAIKNWPEDATPRTAD